MKFNFFGKVNEQTKEPDDCILDQDWDYEVANHQERLFFRNEYFTIEITEMQMTTPPEGWTEKEFAIIKFKYDIHHGEEYIKRMDKEHFETLVGGWINKELESKN